MSKILVAEDDSTSAAILSSLLRKMGYEPILCANGKDALNALLDQEDIQCLITDLKMPEMDGQELLEIVRKLPKYNDMPIVVVSAYLGVNSSYELMEKGAQAVIAKPVEAKELQHTLKRNLKL